MRIKKYIFQIFIVSQFYLNKKNLLNYLVGKKKTIICFINLNKNAIISYYTNNEITTLKKHVHIDHFVILPKDLKWK